MTTLEKTLTEDYEIIIKPKKGFLNLNIREIWLYRELLFIFVWRDIKVKYKQTALGVLWAIIPPLLSMLIFSVIFGLFAGIETEYGIPYPIFVLVGVIIWTYFSTSLSFSSNSLVSYQSMIQKIYFPRILLPFSSIISGLVELSISFIILIFFMFLFNFIPDISILVIFPFVTIITILSLSGFSFILSAINVKYRDVRYILPFIIQMGIFLTPVIYPLSIFKEWGVLLYINPLTAVIESARSSLTGVQNIDFSLLILSFILSLFYFIIGLVYFDIMERDFADII